MVDKEFNQIKQIKEALNQEGFRIFNYKIKKDEFTKFRQRRITSTTTAN